MFNFPFENKGAYASPLLSVVPDAQDTFDLTKGMYRAIKYHFCTQEQEYDATGTTTYPKLSGFMSPYAIPAGNSPWDETLPYYYYSPKKLYGLSAVIGDVLPGAKLDPDHGRIDWCKQNYDDAWVNFMLMVCQKPYELLDQASFTRYNANHIVFPPLYSADLEKADNFSNYNRTFLVKREELAARAMTSFELLGQDLNADDYDWLGSFSLNTYNFGTSLFQYGQLAKNDNYNNCGVAIPFLQMTDFMCDSDYSSLLNLERLYLDYGKNPVPVEDAMAFPENLSVSNAIDLSLPYAAICGAGVDSYATPIVRKGQDTGLLSEWYCTNHRMLFQNYVALCDFYRTFCTSDVSGERNRCHIRWACQPNVWNVGDTMFYERRIEHKRIGGVLADSLSVSSTGAEFDVQYSTLSSFNEISSSNITEENLLSVSRSQGVGQVESGSGIQFNGAFLLSCRGLFDQTQEGLYPSPDLDAETAAWLDRLFPVDDSEDKRQEDVEEVYLSGMQELSGLQQQIDDYTDRIFEMDKAIVSADLEVHQQAVDEEGYQRPELPWSFDDFYDKYWPNYDWWEDGIMDQIWEDDRYPTDEEKEQRLQEVLQTATRMLDEAYAEGGPIDDLYKEVDRLIDEQNELAAEFDRRFEKYDKAIREIRAKVYYPTLPSQEDIDRLKEYIKPTGTIEVTGSRDITITTTTWTEGCYPISDLTELKWINEEYGAFVTTTDDTIKLWWPSNVVAKGPLKQCLVREWCPKRFDIDIPGSDPVEADKYRRCSLSERIMNGDAAFDGEYYKTGLIDYAFSMLPEFWTNAGTGKRTDWRGQKPTIPYLPTRTEHVSIQWEGWSSELTLRPTHYPAGKITWKHCTYNGEERLDLMINEDSDRLMSTLRDRTYNIGSQRIGTGPINPERIDTSKLKWWNNDVDYRKTALREMKYKLRSARMALT